MKSSTFGGLVLALVCFMSLEALAQKPLSFGYEQKPQAPAAPSSPQGQQRPQIQPPRDDPSQNPQILPAPEDMGHLIQTRQIQQGNGYANYPQQPQRQPYSIGGQRYFLPLPTYNWWGPGYGGNRPTTPKPGSCYRPNNQGGGFGSNSAYTSGGNNGAFGQQGGNRPTTPLTTPRPSYCRVDRDCPGNKKCCYGACSTPAFVG